MDLSACQDMGEARAQACPGQGQETGGFAEAQTGWSVGRPMSRCWKASRVEAEEGRCSFEAHAGWGLGLNAEC